MNWIEIDKILYNIIERNDTVEEMYLEAEKQFKWNRSQAKAAIDPLLKRHTLHKVVEEPVVKRSKRSTKSKKTI